MPRGLAATFRRIAMRPRSLRRHLVICALCRTARFRESLQRVELVAFSLYSLIRPRLPTASEAGRFTDGIVSTLNGALGGATGFAGIVLTIWCTLRGWPPPEQRAVFQPVGVFVFLLTALFLGGTGTIAPGTVSLFLIGLPAVAIGTWSGLKLLGRLDETGFRRVILVLLLASGIALLLRLR